MCVEALARDQETAVLQWEDIGWRAGQASEVEVIAQPWYALEVESLYRSVSGPQQVDMSGAGVCPGDTESSVTKPERGVQAHAEEVPCGASAVTAKRRAQALKVEAVQAPLFVKAKMSDMPAGCPRLEPRIWRAKIA